VNNFFQTRQKLVTYTLTPGRISKCSNVFTQMFGDWKATFRASLIA